MRSEGTVPKSTKKQLAALWLQVHKWIGLLLAVLIIPISVTGAALVWHDWLEAQLEPQRHEVLGAGRPAASAYALRAGRARAGERLTSLRFSPEGEPVVAVASKAREAAAARADQHLARPARRLGDRAASANAGSCA
jgi:uncharacterized iron-regulated membrane protein